MPFGGLLSAGISAGGSLLGGLFGSSASSQYIQALQQAQQQMQAQEQQGLQNYQPYMQAGGQVTGLLSNLLGTQGQGLLTPWTQQFTAPTAAQAAQTPGYQFQLQQGEAAAQNSAAGQGGLLSGRTLGALNNYAQGTASENYQNVFNNALTQYQSAYNSFLNNQNNTYGRLMGLSGEGLQATQGAGQFMSGMSGNIASLMGQQGAAAAGGTMALGSGISGAMNNIGGGLMLNSLLGGNNSSMEANFGSAPWIQGGSIGGPVMYPGGIATNPYPSGVVPGLSTPSTPQF